MPNIVATPVESLFSDGGEPAAPGSFKFYSIPGSDEPYGLNFVCPCGCGAVLGVSFRNREGHAGPVWQWNGSREKPSTTPSIRVIGGCGWHGYLTDGEFRTC